VGALPITAAICCIAATRCFARDWAIWDWTSLWSGFCAGGLDGGAGDLGAAAGAEAVCESVGVTGNDFTGLVCARAHTAASIPATKTNLIFCTIGDVSPVLDIPGGIVGASHANRRPSALPR